MALGSRTHSVARGFVAGGLAAFAGTLILPLAFQPAHAAVPLPRALSMLLWELPIPLSLAAGGLLAGRALEHGRRETIAVGLAMLVAGTVQSVVLGDVGRLTGRENPILAVTLLISTGVGAFVAGGTCAGALLKMRTTTLGQVVAGFAGAGLLGALPAVGAFFLVRGGAGAVLGPAFPLALLLLQAASILGPFFVSGVVLARATESNPP